MTSNTILNFPKLVRSIINYNQRRCMPVNVPPTASGKRRFRFEVETDAHKLVNFCCGLNYHINEEPIKLKSDKEYPDWLWNLRLGPKPNSWEMERGTKEYYLKLAEEGRSRNYLIQLRALNVKKVVGKTLIERDEYVKRLRFAALAHMEEDAGFEQSMMESDWRSMSNDTIKARDYYLPKNDNKVLYMDKIKGNLHLKNYYLDEESSFKKGKRCIKPRGPLTLVATQDSKRRHRHSIF